MRREREVKEGEVGEREERERERKEEREGASDLVIKGRGGGGVHYNGPNSIDRVVIIHFGAKVSTKLCYDIAHSPLKSFIRTKKPVMLN